MKADLILCVGARLSVPQIGHWPEKFAPGATLIMVDIDPDEISKRTLRVDFPVVCDAKVFLENLTIEANQAWEPWLEMCRNRRDAYPVINEHLVPLHGINAYHFLRELSKQIKPDAVIVTDVGTSFVPTMQSMPMTGLQRMFHAPGIAPMGYGLPAAIGAAMSGRQTICLTGDGGTMFNMQELQTIVHHKLPIKIFYYDNGGYKTMQTTQGNHFGRETTARSGDGISWPDFWSIATAFGIDPIEVTQGNLHEIPDLDEDWASIYIMKMDLHQIIAPLVKTKMDGAKFVPTSIEHMWPSVL
jgi:acetolactate synthase-1/2/3 large subunit